MGKDHLRFIRDRLFFLMCVSLVRLAKLLLVPFALAEAVGMVWVCHASCDWGMLRDHPAPPGGSTAA